VVDRVFAIWGRVESAGGDAAAFSWIRASSGLPGLREGLEPLLLQQVPELDDVNSRPPRTAPEAPRSGGGAGRECLGDRAVSAYASSVGLRASC